MNNTASHKFGIGRMIGLGLLALIAVLLLWNMIWRAGNNRAVTRLEAAARERGEPITIQDLAASYAKVPDEENIHRALIKVWSSEDSAYWNAFMNGTRPLPEEQEETFDENLPYLGTGSKFNYTNELDPTELAAVRDFLAQKKPHMDAVRAALRLKEYRANYDFNLGYAMLMPELSKIKREAQFFALDALDAISVNDNRRAVAAIGDITHTGDTLKADPTLIGQLVRIACYNIAISTTERLLKQRPVTETECGQLEQILAGMKQDDGIKRALVTERAFAWFVLDGPLEQLAYISMTPGDEINPSGAPLFGLRLMRLVGMTGAEKRLMGETYDQAIRCLAKADYATTDEMHDIFATMIQKAQQFPPRILTQMLMPALEKASGKAARLEALRRCALTALAVERHRLAHKGALPAQLSELGSVALDDPFTGQPLRLKKTERGYVIYSFGPDRKDNDANLDAPRSGSATQQADIGFRVEYVGAR